ncbi:MAG: flavin reductase family protein [Clostridiales bacterium]|nr:flavin reductase family protein [Clostridiales bacterium]
MDRIHFKPGTMIYPVPAVMVTCGDNQENFNIITIAWTGTVSTDPPMTYVSIRKSRHSHEIIKNSREFVINLTTENTLKATDFSGVKSGRDINKFSSTGLTPIKGQIVSAPLIKECPVNIECKVKQIIELGSHDMFLAEVVAVNVDPVYMDENNKFHLEKSKPIAYSHGTYYSLGKALGKFGFSVMKKKRKTYKKQAIK